MKIKALATQLVFDGSRAVGVEYLQDGAKTFVGAEREVILAGGTINSPQLLMLSGIGDPAELEAHGIAVKVPLSGVGKNLPKDQRYKVELTTLDTQYLPDVHVQQYNSVKGKVLAVAQSFGTAPTPNGRSTVS